MGRGKLNSEFYDNFLGFIVFRVISSFCSGVVFGRDVDGELVLLVSFSRMYNVVL